MFKVNQNNWEQVTPHDQKVLKNLMLNGSQAIKLCEMYENEGKNPTYPNMICIFNISNKPSGIKQMQIFHIMVYKFILFFQFLT